MQGLIIIILIVSVVLSAFSSEKKAKQKMENRMGGKNSPMPNLNQRQLQGNRANVHSGHHNRKQASNEQKILEKATQNTANTNYSFKTEVAKDREQTAELPLPNSAHIRKPVQAVRVPKLQPMPKKDVLTLQKVVEPQILGDDILGLAKVSADSVFDDFCASDALYLARKDALSGKIWI